MKKIIEFFKNDEGATVPEYALMLAVIAAVVVTAVVAIGDNASSIFTFIGDKLGENVPSGT
jgi:Flp pilus assembly pilin Flp